MSDLSSFAKLMQTAAAEKAAKLAAEQKRKESEIAPLLSEMFDVVAKSKQTVSKTDQNVPEQIILQPAPSTVQNTSKVAEGDPLEVKFTKILNKLQSEISTLHRQINSRPVGYGTGGSGEVRVLRMDDVRTANLDQDAILAYDAPSKMYW